MVEDRELTESDHAAGVLSDQIVLIGQNDKPNSRPNHNIRLVCVIIACMLISLWTYRKPTMRTYGFYFCGLADEDELMAHIEKMKPHDA